MGTVYHNLFQLIELVFRVQDTIQMIWTGCQYFTLASLEKEVVTFKNKVVLSFIVYSIDVF